MDNFLQKKESAFNKKIIDFQNTKFILAKLKAEINVARIFTDKCIKEHVENSFSAEDGAMAKLWCTDLQFKVIDECYNYLVDMVICKNIRLQSLFRCQEFKKFMEVLTKL